MSNNVLPIINISTTHHEDRKIVDFSRVTAKARFDNFETHEQVLLNLKQEVKENVDLHYKNITTNIDGNEVKTHVGNQDLEHKGVKVFTHHGDSTKVQNGDKIKVLNGKSHVTHFGDSTEILEGNRNITQKGNLCVEMVNLETKMGNVVQSVEKNLRTKVAENKNTFVLKNNTESIEGQHLLEVKGNCNAKIHKNSIESITENKILNTDNFEITTRKNLVTNVLKNSMTKVKNNSFHEVDGNEENIIHKNKTESVDGTLRLNVGNIFETIHGVENKAIIHDQSLCIQGNQNITVEKDMKQHSNQDIELSSNKTLTLKAPEKRLTGGCTVIDTLLLTSPNGVRWGLVVDNHGNLKTARLSDD